MRLVALAVLGLVLAVELALMLGVRLQGAPPTAPEPPGDTRP